MLDEKIEPSQDTANTLKPGTLARNFPSPSVTTKFTSIPRLLLLPVGVMRINQFHAIFSQFLIKWIVAIRPITDQMFRQSFCEPR